MEFLEPNFYDKNQISLKIVIAGKSEVGKSFFFYRINSSYSQFKKLNLSYIATIGFDFANKNIKFQNKIFSLKIWDTCGNDIYQSLIMDYFRKTDIFLIFYDAFDIDSFKRAKSYFENIKKLDNKNPIYVLVRSKYDNNLNKEKNNNNFIRDEEALKYADENNMYYYHIGTKEKFETGINDLFEFILNKYIKQMQI